MTEQVTAPLVHTVPEAAGQLRLGLNATYALIRQGRLRAIRVNRRIIVPHSAIREFLGEAE